MKRIAMLLNAENPNNAAQFERLKTAAQAVVFHKSADILRASHDISSGS